MARWGTRDCQRLIRWYQDETGILEFKLADVAEWAENRGLPMPVPPTPADILTRKLSKAARAERRPGPGNEYRGLLAFPRGSGAQIEFSWFDADGPRATLQNMRRAQNFRREGMINDGVQIAANDRRWNQTHQGQGTLATDFDLADEVTWRLNGPASGEADEKAS